MEPFLHRLLCDCLSPHKIALEDYQNLRLPAATAAPDGVDTDNYDSDPHQTSLALFVSTTTQEEREQALRDYKVTIEYKHLKSHAPGGVYLVPSLHDLRLFYGIIFVRRGPYTNGIFKFQLILPPEYNSLNTYPRIIFSSYVYNPHVNPATGELDIETAYPRWDSTRHYLVTVLTFLKKIFYSKTFKEAKANGPARDLSEQKPAEYRENVEQCVRESQKEVYVNPEGSTARFTEEQLSHRVLRDLLKANVRDPTHVSKQAILSMIDKASKV